MATARTLFTRWESPLAVGLALLFLLDEQAVLPLPGIVGLALCASIFVVGVLRRRSGRAPAALPSAASAALFAVLTLSVFWSDVPDYTGERLRTYAPALAAAWFAGATLRRHEFVTVLQWFARISIGLYVVLIAVFPWAREPEIGGPPGWHANLSKNGLGLALVLLMAIVLAVETGWMRIAEMIALLVMSAGNQSRTSQLSILAIIAACGAWAWLDRARGPLQRRSRGLLLAAAAALGGLGALYGKDLVLAAVGKDPTLTSRTVIWEAASDQIAKAPWLGHGAFAFLEPQAHSPSQQAVARYFHLFVPPHSHSGVLDLAGQIGYIGLLAYLATLASAAWAVHRSGDRLLNRLGLYAGLFLLFAAPVEPLFLGGWLIVLLFIDGCARRLTTIDRLPGIHA